MAKLNKKTFNHSLELKYNFCNNLITNIKNENLTPSEFSTKYNLSQHSVYAWLNAYFLIRYKDIGNLPSHFDAEAMMVDQSNNSLKVENGKNKKIAFTPGANYMFSKIYKIDDDIDIDYFKQLLKDFDVYFQMIDVVTDFFTNLTSKNIIQYYKNEDDFNNKKVSYKLITVKDNNPKKRNDKRFIFEKNGELVEKRLIKYSFYDYYYRAIEAVHCEAKVDFLNKSKKIVPANIALSNIYYCITSNILKHCKSRNYQYIDLAAAMGIGERTVRSWFYKNKPLTDEHKELLSNVFNQPVDKLLYDVGNNFVSIFDENDLSTMYQNGRIDKRSRIGVTCMNAEQFPTHQSIGIYNFNKDLVGFELLNENKLLFIFTDINYVNLNKNNWYLELIFNKEIKNFEIKWIKETNNQLIVSDSKDVESANTYSIKEFNDKFNRFAVMTRFDYYYNKTNDINSFNND